MKAAATTILLWLVSLSVELTLQYPRQAGGLVSSVTFNPPRKITNGPNKRNRPQRGNASSYLSFNKYPTVKEIDDYLTYLARNYPDLVEIEVLNHSAENYWPIKVLHIYNGRKSLKNVHPNIIVDAGIHAREWISPMSALYLINQLVENNTYYERLTRNVNWHIIPLLNPDGYDYSMRYDRMWRKNRANIGLGEECRGVDLNRNFDIYWGGNGTSTDPCDEIYIGDRPFGEPEARALRKLATDTRNVKLYLTLHSYGPFILYPFGYGDVLPKDWMDLDRLARKADKAASKVRGQHFQVGSSTRLLGPGAGGSDDWFKRRGVKYVYTIELPGDGMGFELKPSHIPEVVAESFEAFRTMAEHVAVNCSRNARPELC